MSAFVPHLPLPLPPHHQTAPCSRDSSYQAHSQSHWYSQPHAQLSTSRFSQPSHRYGCLQAPPRRTAAPVMVLDRRQSMTSPSAKSATSTTTTTTSKSSVASSSAAPTSAVSRSRARRVRSCVAREWRGEAPGRMVQVLIERPAPNRRVIRAANVISASMEEVWGLLSDYDRLAEHIPNLVESRLCAHPRGGIRLAQCGAQRILGFQFRAALVMDMREEGAGDHHERAIHFDLVESNDFTRFSGSWVMIAQEPNKTVLFYSVDIIPKGLVPVAAIEWRIAEDIPQNMDAVRLECERRRRTATATAARTRQLQQQQREEQKEH